MAGTLWMVSSLFKGTVWNNYYWYLWPERVFSSLAHTPPRPVFIWDPGVSKLQWLVQKSLLVRAGWLPSPHWLSVQGWVGFLANRRRHVSLCVCLCVFALLSWEMYHHGQCWGEETNSSFIMPSALWEMVAGMSIVSCRRAFNEGKT